MAAASPVSTYLSSFPVIEAAKGNSDLIVNANDDHADPLMQLLVLSEEQHNAQTEETALALQRFLGESKQRVDELLKEILYLKEQLVNADSRHHENELLLRAQIVSKDQELAVSVSEVRKLTLKIGEIEERANQRITAALAEKNEAVSNAIKAGKIAEQTAIKAGESAVQVIKAQMTAMQAGQEAKQRDAEASMLKIKAEKLAVEQAAASQIAELKLRMQMLETQNGKLQRGAEKLKQSIRDTFEFHCQPVSAAERAAMEAGFNNVMENS